MNIFKTWDYEYQDDYIYELYSEMSKDLVQLSNIARNLFNFLREHELLEDFKEYMKQPVALK